MKKIEFSKEKKKEIIDMYNDKTIKVQEILKTCGISAQVLSRLLREESVPFRLQKAAGPRTNIVLGKCPICGIFLASKDARFCYKCGADVRSKGEKLIEQLADAWCILYPHFKNFDEKEKIKKIFEDVKDYIKKYDD